jgi:replication factor A2
VGQVRNISVQATNILYKFDDGTGTIEVKQWINTEEPTDSLKVSENSYARVWGKLESFNDKKYVSCRIVRPVEDLNETSYHFLEAAYVHLYFTRGPPEDKKAGGAGQQDGGLAGGMSGMGGDAETRGLSPAARKIFQLFKTAPQNNEGLHMQDIASRLGMDTVDVGRAGDELLGQGLIYTTVDDNTWNIL